MQHKVRIVYGIQIDGAWCAGKAAIDIAAEYRRQSHMYPAAAEHIRCQG